MRRTIKRILLGLGIFILGVVFLGTLGANTAHLKVEMRVSNADIGIPGISKMYEATLSNRGRLPVRITRCDFLDDTLSSGTMVAYAVQRWDNDTRKWEAVVQSTKANFCKPYPLGIVKATLVKGWLWPGKTLSTGEEATAARGGFSLGDRARFVIFLGEAGDYSSSMATTEFQIDEHPQTNVNLRVRH